MALSEKKKASNAKWDADNLKRLSLAMLTKDFEAMEKHIQKLKDNATGEGKKETRNGFINRAIQETIIHDNDKMNRKEK